MKSVLVGLLLGFAAIVQAAPGGPGGANGNSGGTGPCPGVEQLIQDLASPDPDVRLTACRALRKPWQCGEGEVAPGNSGGGGNGGGPHKIRIVSTAAAPDAFSPDPDTFLDTTTLSAAVAVRRTDAAGSGTPNHVFFVELEWSIHDESGAAIRTVRVTRLVEFPSEHGPDFLWLQLEGSVVWDGRNESGAIQPDGAYPFVLEARYFRETVNHGSEISPELTGHRRGFVKLIDEDSATGSVTIDESIGEALRQTAEEALIARLADPDPAVRRAAIATLQVLGSELSIDPLTVVLVNIEGENDPITAGFSAVALVRLGQRTGIDTVSDLQAALLSSPSDLTRALIIRALGTTYDPAHAVQLSIIRDDETESDIVRESARRAVTTIERTLPEAP